MHWYDGQGSIANTKGNLVLMHPYKIKDNEDVIFLTADK